MKFLHWLILRWFLGFRLILRLWGFRLCDELGNEDKAQDEKEQTDQYDGKSSKQDVRVALFDVFETRFYRPSESKEEI